MQTTIKLPTARVDQLRALGAALNFESISEVVGYLIRTQINAGTLANVIPGIEVTATSRDRIVIRVEGCDAVPFTTDAAAALADQLSEPPSRTAKGFLDVDADYRVIRRGSGVQAAIPADATTVSMSLDLAKDLANVITAQIDVALSL